MNMFEVLLSLYPYRASWKVDQTTAGIESDRTSFSPEYITPTKTRKYHDYH